MRRLEHDRLSQATPLQKSDGGGGPIGLTGSGLLILWAAVIGTPLGILAEIYLSEYGR